MLSICSRKLINTTTFQLTSIFFLSLLTINMQQQPHFAAVKLFFRFGSSNKIVRLLPSSFSNFNNSNSLWSLADETLDVSLLEQTIINTLVSQPGQLLTPIAGVGGGVSLRIVGFGGSQDYFDSHQQESLDIRLNLPAKPIVKYLEENQDCLPSNFDKILFHASEDETKDLNTITNNEIHRHCNQKVIVIGRPSVF